MAALMWVDLLSALRGAKPPPAERPLRELPSFEQRMTILRAKWDRERPTECEEPEPAVVYTALSAMHWLRRTESELGRPVTTSEIITRRAGIKYPSTLSCKRLAHTLRRGGATSFRENRQTHLRWSAR